MNPIPFKIYLQEIQRNLSTGQATEQTHRSALKALLESVSSANQGEHIEKLMERYKAAVRGERNIQPLSDDYIKFIRFAHDRIERTGYGVIGMITNHSYLSGLIHRGMREELMKSFDEIYVLNLHGNALMGETAPDGGPDENVFDIRQGVAIVFMIKLGGGDCDGRKTSGKYECDTD